MLYARQPLCGAIPANPLHLPGTAHFSSDKQSRRNGCCLRRQETMWSFFVVVPETNKRLKISSLSVSWLFSLWTRWVTCLERILPSGFASSRLSIPGRAAATRRNSLAERKRRRRRRKIRGRGERRGEEVWIIAIKCLYINLNIHLYIEYIKDASHSL